MHRERNEHIATSRTLSPEEELLPHHHGNQKQRWRWWWRSMEMAPGALPHPGRVPEYRLSVPRISPSVAAALWNFSWLEVVRFRVFASEASIMVHVIVISLNLCMILKVIILPGDTWSQNTRRRRARGWPHHLVAQSRPGRARGWCGPLQHPLGLPSRL